MDGGDHCRAGASAVKMETEIFGLMTAAQDEQAAVLKEERRLLAETLVAVQNQLVLARWAADEIGPELQRRVDYAVRAAVAEN